jgi:hypothetical protein
MIPVIDISLIIMFILISLFFLLESVVFTAVLLSELFQPIIPGIKPPLRVRTIRFIRQAFQQER